MEAALSELEAALGYRFTDPELLILALTHRSVTHQSVHEPSRVERRPEPARPQPPGRVEPGGANNERLEFLGDAVLNLVVAESLFASHPDWQEGELTRVRAQLVSRPSVAAIAAEIEVGRYLRLSRGEERSGLRANSTVLSNAMEAVIGALFLDGGLEPVRALVLKQVMGEAAVRLAEQLRSGAALGNYKSALQQRLQATRAGTALYRVKFESGPDHHKRFLVEVRIKTGAGELAPPLARGLGRTKKYAEQDAARRALERLEAGAPAPSAGPDPAREGQTAQ
jgi:ribonuclease III